jgi:hypothetical protein
MDYEKGIPDFAQWFGETWWVAVALAVGGTLVGLMFGFLVSAAQHGPTEAFYRVAKQVFSAVGGDLPGFSLRRTFAIAWLVIQESLRKRVLMAVVGVFVVILLFAGWFLDPRADDPGKLYLSFVLSTSNLLVIFMSLFLATLSLPNDMKSRTIYTVVTKPIRSSEIVLGRVCGFAAVGSALLLIMGVLSYVFVSRGLTHSHIVDADTVKEVHNTTGSKELLGYEGRTTVGGSHEHSFKVDVNGVGATDLKQGHRHEVTRSADGSYVVGPPTGQLEARVPVYGELRWLDREGRADEKKGISVGHEWEYRRYISGGTKSAAIWTFNGITRDRFKPYVGADGTEKCFLLETNIRVFRTYKGDIEKNILGSITLRNPNLAKNKRSAPILHRFKEFETDAIEIPLKVKKLPEAGSGREVKVTGEYDLFDDLVEDGQLEVILQCQERAQYYGVAQPDVYIRAADHLFVVNFMKCFLTLWLEMVVVVAFGVFFSTFLSGPIAFVGTIATLIVGFFIDFVREVVHGMFSSPEETMAYKGGGPIESIIRIMTQQNISTELEGVPQGADAIIKTIDKGFAIMLYATTYVVPTFSDFDTVRQVAYGYDIDFTVLSILCLKALGYAAGTTLVAYFVLKTREIASES